MNKKTAVILGVSIILASLILGFLLRDALKDNEALYVNTNDEVLTVTEAADYLKLTKDEVMGIIITEKKELSTKGIFLGNMFPYYKVNDKYYFSKSQLNEWLMDVTKNRGEYDLKNYSRK